MIFVRSKSKSEAKCFVYLLVLASGTALTFGTFVVNIWGKSVEKKSMRTKLFLAEVRR